MTDTSHLDSLNLQLSNERSRLDAAKSEGERALRSQWVRQLENQVADELKFLGQTEAARVAETETSDEELLRELGL
jgi:hypothetical protein